MQEKDTKTITQIYIDAHGEYKTRVWKSHRDKGVVSQTMEVCVTDKSQIRPLRTSLIFKPNKIIRSKPL